MSAICWACGYADNHGPRGECPADLPEDLTPKPAEKLLVQIAAQVREALAALDDEHEGNARRAVSFIEADAHKLAELVRSW
jgi:hypothetical protein